MKLFLFGYFCPDNHFFHHLTYTMKPIFTLLFVCLATALVHAQAYRCGYVEAMQAREAQTPGYIAACDKAFQELKQQSAIRSNDVYKIKTVFHVLYNDQNQNVPDSVIYNQLAILNQDYRRQNPDSVNTRSLFVPFAGDAKIEFVLADKDPQGNPTTGIHRVQSATSFALAPFNDNVKQASAGGTDAWDTRYYLNIWVCDMSLPLIGPAVLGYAYPPNNLPNWPANSGATAPELEGVVIHYQAIGSNNPFVGVLDNLVDRGRTATHEIGHFLGLRHIWGDGDCTQDDGVDDTPDASDNAQQQCDWTKNTCTESTGAQFPDMIENYMDYSADSCMNLFTRKQIDIMRAVLEGPRYDLIAWNLSDISESDLTKQFSISPNPAQQQLRLNFDNPQQLAYQLYIQNTLGKSLMQPISGSQHLNQTLDLAAFAPGVYVVTIVLENGARSSLKFVKI